MKKTKVLIYRQLVEDSVLLNMVNGHIYYTRPEKNIQLPSVLFWEVSGYKDREHNFEEEIFQIDIFGQENVDDIAERVDTLLDGKRFKDNSDNTVIVWIEQMTKGEDFESDVFHKYIRYRVVTNLNV